ncbi:MAG: hypothetical protein C0617_12090 [Desulfuromonas sp.]|uniref:hypothetical protein n=1 Tax=Desulfuromonas sp. TaxID=892 RepID=UPI000CC609E8|nr:hypothetical protein [Desulfuromonas sp.]PLX83266.1 MAG: hypothetical protein C0617_12090 [Desulfuromonas sp.]
MQKVEITDTAELKVHCPFCGKVALKPDGTEACEHTLFLAADEGGFVYVSPRLDFDADVDLDEQTMDEFTDAIEFPDSVKFAIYQPAPSFFGGYVAFAPVK